jgi:hypothetical protein
METYGIHACIPIGVNLIKDASGKFETYRQTCIEDEPNSLMNDLSPMGLVRQQIRRRRRQHKPQKGFCAFVVYLTGCEKKTSRLQINIFAADKTT